MKMKRENGLQEFFRTTYNTGSPIPYILSIQIGLFIIIHIADLLVDLNVINFPLYDWFISNLTLPSTFGQFIKQPWSLFTFPFVYDGLFKIIFDCLWLYWIGNTFLNFLNKRQFLTIYFSAFFIGGFAFLGLGEFDFLRQGPQPYLFTNVLGLAALVASLTILLPKMEVSLLLFGRVKFIYIALVFFGFQLMYYVISNQATAICFMISIGWGILFMKQLQSGNDLSLFFKKSKRNNLRIIHKTAKSPSYKSHQADLPNQEVIDEILDKISQNGYESLSSREKEILFKVSREGKE